MKLLLKLPQLLRFLLIFIVSLTLLFVLMRVAFYIAFDDPQSQISMSDFLYSMWIGLRFDLRMSVIMTLPLFFLGWIKWLSPFKYTYMRYFWLLLLVIPFAVMALFYIVDFGHFAYLNSRIDFSALRFLENMAISSQMVWESYPVVWIMLAYLSVIAIFTYLTNRLFINIAKVESPKLSIGKGIVVGFLAFIVMLVAGYSKLSQYPLRWSDASFSKHPFSNMLAYNPTHYFLDTWKNGRISYDKKIVQTYYPLMAEYLDVDNKNIETLNFKRSIPAVKKFDTKPNVVIVIMESFATYKSSVSGNPVDPSPHVKALADSGLYFKNFYTPSTGTARSIYCSITSLPDVELKGTSSRNPLIVNQHSIAEDFKGYSKAYFIGGSASWGNIRGMLNQSMDNLKLYEEEDYSAPRTDVWGISDADLAIEANKALAKTKEPFFAVIQTSGNHRPYTIPDNAHGFKVRTDISEEEVKKYGFGSVKEYNSFRFLDYSVGLFMSEAKKEPYFKNTIFAFWGDHGISGYSGEHVSVGESSSKLGLGSYRVPFIIYSPLIKEPKVYDKVVSEPDVLPTLASLVGIPYIATTIGRDMLDEKYDDSRFSFTIHHSSNPTIGLIGEKYYFRTKADGTNAGLYDIFSDEPLKEHSKENDELMKRMKDLTYGIYETSKYIPYFNKRECAEN